MPFPLLRVAAPLLALTALAQTAAPPDHLDTLITQRMNDAGLMGLAAVVLVDNQVIWARGFGFRDAARTLPFTPDTPTKVASITKTFTGVALMQLAAEGKLSLDADVNTYLPFPVRNPNFPHQPITLRMLATHTSSITDRWDVYRHVYHFAGEPSPPLGQFLTSYFTPTGSTYSPSNYLTVPPGAERDYSNIGASLAGYIVERLSGQTLPQYVQRRILSPLGMSATAWSPRNLPARAASTLFIVHSSHSIPIPSYDVTTYPDGGLWTSAHDLSRFLRALLNHGALDRARILPTREADEMLRFQFSGPSYPKGYGPSQGNSGIFWRTKFSGSRMGHGGNDPGVQAEMLSSLDRRLAVILLSNTSVTGADARAFNDIFQAVWKHAEARLR
mgnify:CR=1 FL=1